MNLCLAYMTVQRGGNGLQDDDYLTQRISTLVQLLVKKSLFMMLCLENC